VLIAINDRLPQYHVGLIRVNDQKLDSKTIPCSSCRKANWKHTTLWLCDIDFQRGLESVSQPVSNVVSMVSC